MKRRAFASVILMTACQAWAVEATVAESMGRLRENVRAITLAGAESPAIEAMAKDALGTMRPDGSWADVDYADTDRVRWKAQPHLPRLRAIACAAYRRDGKPDAATRERIVASLRYWLDADPKNVNWWHNEIGVPRQVGEILVIAGDDVPAEVREKGVALMRRADWTKQTGANLIDETWIQVMRGCVEQSPAVVDEAFKRTWEELRIFGIGEEGIQPDGSFHQHGPMLYSQSYGGVYIGVTLKFLEAAKGTIYRAPDSAFDALATFTLDGSRWMRRGNVWDWSACGRAFTRPGVTRDNFNALVAALAQYATGERAESFRSVAKLPADDASPIGNKYFWRSEYLVHRRPGFHVSTRMYSTRLANTDILTNGENKLSHHIADGATCVMIDGQEYFDIYPVWDWERIPGTTVEQGGPMSTKKIRRFGGSDVAGGVSDGELGACGMTLVYDALSAKKAWFCFDEVVVCLGTEIRSDTGREVVTTLNQAWLDGPIAVDNRWITPGGDPNGGARAVWHDGVGYVSLDPTAGFEVRAGKQQGAWSKIGLGPSTPIERDVFLASWSHGKSPANGSYAYALLPGVAQEQMAETAARVKVLSNTAALQAVARPGDGAVQAIFREAGEVGFGDIQIAVKHPCALMLRPMEKELQLTVASLDGRSSPVSVALTVKGNRREIEVELPAGNDTGRPKKLLIKRSELASKVAE